MAKALKKSAVESQQKRIAQLAAGLNPNSTRFMMFLIVSGAAVVGFLSSVVLLWMGLRYMPIRYAIAWAAGYGVFLLLMNRWLGHHSSSWLVDRATDGVDLPDGLLRGGSRAAGRTADTLFRGGRSGGGGASASFDAPGAAPQVQPLPIMTSSSAGSGESRGWSLDSLDLDDDDNVLAVLAIAAIVAVIVACASVIWQSPQMLAELLADGAAAGVAYKGLRASAGQWTLGLLRRTCLPAVAILVVFVLLGVAGHELQPNADSIGDFFR